MKFPSLQAAAASALMLTGCSNLISLNPFADEKDAVVDPAVAGVWKDNDGDMFIIHRTDSEYSVAYTDAKSKEVAKFRGYLMKVGDAGLFDLVSTEEDAFQVPVHVVVRVWPEGSVLRWIFLDSKWLREQAEQQLPTQPSGKRTLITAPAEAVRALVLKYGADARAYEGEPMVLNKVM